MVQANPEFFIPNERVCVTIMNGKTDLLILNPRHSGCADLSTFLANDEKSAVDIAKNLGMTV